MKKISKSVRLKIGTVITFLIVIVINTLANLFRFNGTTTGEVSRIYDSLFVPVSFSFLIWFLIYFFMFLYVVFILFAGKAMESDEKKEFYSHLTIYFIVSSIVNICWVLSWHNDLMMMAMVCTCVLFAVLCLIFLSFRKVHLTKAETAFIQIPFSFYFGWIIFSIVANASVVMTKFSIATSGKTEEDWTMIMVAFLTIFTVFLKIFGRNPIFGIPVLWGLFGILYKHISMDGYGYQYPDLIMELMICIGILIIITAYYMFSGKAFTRKKRSIIEEMSSVMNEATAETIVNHTFKEYEVADELHKKKEQEEKERELERKKNEKKQKREAFINRFFKKRDDERREIEKESCEKVTEEHKI